MFYSGLIQKKSFTNLDGSIRREPTKNWYSGEYHSTVTEHHWQFRHCGGGGQYRFLMAKKQVGVPISSIVRRYISKVGLNNSSPSVCGRDFFESRKLSS